MRYDPTIVTIACKKLGFDVQRFITPNMSGYPI